MLTSKERAELRAQANGLDTTLMVGKGGVTEQVVLEAVTQLEARELVKGRVLEAALLVAREALEALCAATRRGAVCTVGSKFVLYRESEKLRRARNQVGRAKLAPVPVAKSNPVRKGAQAAAEQPRQSGNGATPTSARLPSTGPSSGRRKRPWAGNSHKERMR